LVAVTLLYLVTLDNGLSPEELVGGDLITHQYAQVEGRPSNAPGYPLYTMGGWLWFRLARPLLSWLLNPIQILSFYSTLWGLASLLVLYLILLRATHQQWPVALLLTLFYATTFFFWYYSVTTEQYTSAVFQTLLVIWLAFKWNDRPQDSLLFWLAFISGTMLANMVTTLFILPPLLWFIFFQRDEASRGFLLFRYLKRPKFVLTMVGLALLPLLSYAYVYIRGVQHPEWRGDGNWASTWDWFVQFLTIPQGRDELVPGLTAQGFFTAEFPSLMWQELSWLVFLGGLLGLAFLGRRRAIFLYGTLLIYLFFSWGYRFGNWFQVIIPAYPIFIIGFATGLARVMDWVRVRRSAVGGQPLAILTATAIILLLAGLLIYRFTVSLPEANQHNRSDDTGLNPGWAILADQPDSPALITGTFEERVALQYLHTVWGAAPGIYPANELNPATATIQADRSIYVSRQAATGAPETVEAEGVYPQAAGEQLIALWPQPRDALPSAARRLDLNFGDTLNLLGWEQIETGYPLPEGVNRANWQIVLYWQALVPVADDYTVSVRPVVEGQLIVVDGENMIQDHQPVWGVYPTSRWTPWEIVRDAYALSLPDSVTPDGVQIVVYKTTETGFENLDEATLQINDRSGSE
jgi:hypothetical protein